MHKSRKDMDVKLNRKLKIYNNNPRMLTQNSAKCREVFEFSARKVGPNVYTWQSISMHYFLIGYLCILDYYE